MGSITRGERGEAQWFTSLRDGLDLVRGTRTLHQRLALYHSIAELLNTVPRKGRLYNRTIGRCVSQVRDSTRDSGG